MSFLPKTLMKVDPVASARAREEGNAAFRKGRWADAAAAYARASTADPSDAVALANRAQAWIKLERWTDAERDATQALSRDPTNVKARFRRAVACRALGRPNDAAEDLRGVLAREPNNAPAAGELAELEREGKLSSPAPSSAPATTPAQSDGISGSTAAAPAKDGQGATPAEPIAVPGPARSSTTTPKPTPAATAVPNPTTAPVVTEELPRNPLGPSGFAALRTTRNTRPSYAGTPAPKAKLPETTPRPPTTTVASPPPEPAPASAPAERAAPVPSDPTSTQPGAGLSLLRALATLPPQQRYSYLRHYTPGILPRILDPVLEPDTLGLLLSTLDAGLSGGADKVWAREVLQGLKATKRWRMNAAMLSKAEKEAGRSAWEGAGGEGALL